MATDVETTEASTDMDGSNSLTCRLQEGWPVLDRPAIFALLLILLERGGCVAVLQKWAHNSLQNSLLDRTLHEKVKGTLNTQTANYYKTVEFIWLKG